MILRTFDVRVASVNGSQANSAPILVGGKQVDVDVKAPAALGLIQGSNDTRNWTTATSRVDGSTALSTLADGSHSELFERFKWIRCSVASDASAVRQYDFRIAVHDEPDS